MVRPVGFIAALAVLFASLLISGWMPLSLLSTSASVLGEPTNCRGEPNAVRVFDAATLAHFDGTRHDGPLLLVVLGQVYDVTSGSRFYQRNKSAVVGRDPLGYSIFVGQDSSAAFATGDFIVAQEDVRSLTASQVKAVVDWVDFYKKHAEYTFAGVLHGLYYDCDGQETEVLRSVLRTARVAEERAKAEKELLQRFESCNSQYIPAQKLATVWCPAKDDPHPHRNPRRFLWDDLKRDGRASASAAPVTKDAPAKQQRCACLSEDDEDAVRQSDSLSFEPYVGCNHVPTGEVCRLSV